MARTFFSISTARASSRIISSSAASISIRSGVSAVSRRLAAFALFKIAPSGWLSSCAREAVSSPIVITCETCRNSSASRRISASARFRSKAFPKISATSLRRCTSCSDQCFSKRTAPNRRAPTSTPPTRNGIVTLDLVPASRNTSRSVEASGGRSSRRENTTTWPDAIWPSSQGGLGCPLNRYAPLRGVNTSSRPLMGYVENSALGNYLHDRTAIDSHREHDPLEPLLYLTVDLLD